MSESSQPELSTTVRVVKITRHGDDNAILQVGTATNVASVEVDHGVTFVRFNVVGPVIYRDAVEFIYGLLELSVIGGEIESKTSKITEGHRNEVSKRHGGL